MSVGWSVCTIYIVVMSVCNVDVDVDVVK